MTSLVTVIVGLIIGSFLSMCVYRIPLGRASSLDENEENFEDALEEDRSQLNTEFFDRRVTILYPPRSFCPQCGAQLRWYHNIPVLSWFFQGGKCAHCKERISIRYPVIEILSALFCFLSFYTIASWPTALLVYLFSCSLIVISFIDIDYFIIPNAISYPGMLIGIVIAIINEFTGIFVGPVVNGVQDAFFGLMVGAGFLLFISKLYTLLRKKPGLGLGDVKLLAMTGLLFGPEASIYTIFVGSLFGSVIGIGLVVFGFRRMAQYLPFGPYLAVASVLYLFSGPKLVYYLTQMFGRLLYG